MRDLVELEKKCDRYIRTHKATNNSDLTWIEVKEIINYIEELEEKLDKVSDFIDLDILDEL